MRRPTTSRRTFLMGSAALTAAAVTPGSFQAAAQDNSGYILPANRLLTYYGFPGNELMGILGEYSMEDLLPLLQQQGAAYEAVDPSRPVKLAYEVIASVAQADAGADGNYIAYTSHDTIQRYIDFTAANDLLLILDMQYGRKSTADEIDAIEEFLLYPHVHLALDPEFHVAEGEVPGQDLGVIDAEDANYAQRRLAQLAADHGLPPKILLIHQFSWYSITNKDAITEMDGVQFVLEIDGWGPPYMKEETYDVLANAVPFSYYGFKLWYRQDDPLMTEEEVLGLVPSPDVIIYQ